MHTPHCKQADDKRARKAALWPTARAQSATSVTTQAPRTRTQPEKDTDRHVGSGRRRAESGNREPRTRINLNNDIFVSCLWPASSCEPTGGHKNVKASPDAIGWNGGLRPTPGGTHTQATSGRTELRRHATQSTWERNARTPRNQHTKRQADDLSLPKDARRSSSTQNGTGVWQAYNPDNGCTSYGRRTSRKTGAGIVGYTDKANAE